jgi:hypothetical protein
MTLWAARRESAWVSEPVSDMHLQVSDWYNVRVSGSLSVSDCVWVQESVKECIYLFIITSFTDDLSSPDCITSYYRVINAQKSDMKGSVQDLISRYYPEFPLKIWQNHK